MPEKNDRVARSWLISACVFSLVCWSNFVLYPSHRQVFSQPGAWLLSLGAVATGFVSIRRSLRDSTRSRTPAAAWVAPLAFAMSLALVNATDGDEPFWPYLLLTAPLWWLSQAVTQVVLIKRQPGEASNN